MPKPLHPKHANPASPVLNAWALVASPENEGIDALAALPEGAEQTTPHQTAPTAPVSAAGIPLISRTQIAGLPPNEVAIMFYDAALTAAGREHAEWRLMCQRFHDLPQPWRLVYAVCSFQTQVDNGGLDQFFYNGQGEFDDDTEHDLKILGAGKFLELFTKARLIYNAAPPDRTDRIPELEALTDEFYAQPKDLYRLAGEYILENQNVYCSD